MPGQLSRLLSGSDFVVVAVPNTPHTRGLIGENELRCMKETAYLIDVSGRPVLYDLAALMRPTLTVVDATRILLRNGPTGGNLADVRQEDALAVSLDPVAVDAWATDLLGIKRSKVGYLKLAERRGLGRMDYRSLSPVELKV